MTQETTTQQADTQPTAEPTDRQKFIEMLPEEYRQDSSFAKYQNFGDFVKGAKHAMTMTGMDKNQIVAVPKDGDEKAWREFYSKLGAPENADGYKEHEFKRKDGSVREYNADFLKEFKGAAHKLGLTPQQFKGVLDWYIPLVDKEDEGKYAARDKSLNDTREQLKQEWGAKYDTQVKKIDQLLEIYDPENKIWPEVEKSGLVGNKALWDMLGRMAEDIAEDSLHDGGQPAGGAKTPNEAMMEINRRMGDPEWTKIWQDGGHPRHKEYVSELEELYKFAYPAQRK